MKKWPTPNRITLHTKGAEKNANNLGTFLENIPIAEVETCKQDRDIDGRSRGCRNGRVLRSSFCDKEIIRYIVMCVVDAQWTVNSWDLPRNLSSWQNTKFRVVVPYWWAFIVISLFRSFNSLNIFLKSPIMRLNFTEVSARLTAHAVYERKAREWKDWTRNNAFVFVFQNLNGSTAV